MMSGCDQDAAHSNSHRCLVVSNVTEAECLLYLCAMMIGSFDTVQMVRDELKAAVVIILQ